MSRVSTSTIPFDHWAWQGNARQSDAAIAASGDARRRFAHPADPADLEPVSKALPHPEASFAARERPRRMLQEASNGTLWNVLRGRFAAPQDEETGFWVRLLADGLACRPLVCKAGRSPTPWRTRQFGAFAAVP